MKPRGQSQTTPLSNKSFGFDILLGQGASKTSAMSLANKDLLNCPTLTPKKNFTISASGFKGSELSLAVSSSVRRFNDWNSRNRRKSQHVWASWICGGHIFSIEFNSICGSCTLGTSKIEVLSPVSLKPSTLWSADTADMANPLSPLPNPESNTKGAGRTVQPFSFLQPGNDPTPWSDCGKPCKGCGYP